MVLYSFFSNALWGYEGGDYESQAGSRTATLPAIILPPPRPNFQEPKRSASSFCSASGSEKQATQSDGAV